MKSRYKSFYAPLSFEVTWEKFKEIANSEYPGDARGSSSRLLRKIIEKYVQQKYTERNPQTLIETWVKGEPPERTCDTCDRWDPRIRVCKLIGGRLVNYNTCSSWKG